VLKVINCLKLCFGLCLQRTLGLFISGLSYGHGFRKRTARQTPEDVYVRAGTTETLVPHPFPIFCANDI